jgi:lipoprotein signal peptidase
MDRDSTSALFPTIPSSRKERSTPRATVFALLAAVIVVDQTVKWWAWRDAPWTEINYGGNAFVGATLSRWYANPLTGALLDLLDFGLLSIAVAVLLRRRRPAMILISGSLMVGGWTSNLLDRLGMHYLTAPGSVRGAVDFIHLGQVYYNVADVFIVCGTFLFLLAAGASVVNRPATTDFAAPTTRSRLRARGWMSAIAGAACLIVIVGFGAVNYGGTIAPGTLASKATRYPPVREFTGFNQT